MTDYTEKIDKLLKKLFPITRSITGKGNRETLKAIQEIIPINIKEYPTGTEVYDWIIPKEWNIKEAWIKNAKGEKIIDFDNSNIHIVNYSIPVHKKINYSELIENLYYLEEQEEAIPYRTSYYKESWGFCLSYKQFKELFNENEEYEVFIDSELTEGSLSIGELVIPGKSKKEYLISTYLCHPSLANDNLSGVILTTFLSKELQKLDLNYSYRIVFVPETIGAIAYCYHNEAAMKKIDAGFVVTTVGGPGQFGYKQSFEEKHCINSIIEDIFIENKIDFISYPFDIHGSDERQYSTQGFKINVATISKDKYYEYPYYHTSLDNLDFVKAKYISQSLELYRKAINKLDFNLIYKNVQPHCEAMLSKHDLYPSTGGAQLPNQNFSALDIRLWLLFYCDGVKSLYEISKKINIPLEYLYQEALILEEKKKLVLISE